MNNKIHDLKNDLLNIYHKIYLVIINRNKTLDEIRIINKYYEKLTKNICVIREITTNNKIDIDRLLLLFKDEINEKILYDTKFFTQEVNKILDRYDYYTIEGLLWR